MILYNIAMCEDKLAAWEEQGVNLITIHKVRTKIIQYFDMGLYPSDINLTDRDTINIICDGKTEVINGM